MKLKKQLAFLAAILMLVGMLTACGGKSTTMDLANGSVSSWESSSAEMPENAMDDLGGDMLLTGSEEVNSDQKLIKTVYIDTETEDLETLLGQLAEAISSQGGYLESQEIYNGSAYSTYRYRNANLTIRIPAENLSGFVGTVQDVSNVVRYNVTTENVTLTYVDIESRVTALETEQQRLLELLTQAETMSDLLEIEGRLTEVRYELESVMSQLRTLSNQVDYATVYLSVEQVKVYTETEEPTLWQRITGGFTDNLEDLADGLVDGFVWVITYSPQILFWCAVVLLGFWGGRRWSKKRKMKKNPVARKKEEEPEE